MKIGIKKTPKTTTEFTTQVKNVSKKAKDLNLPEFTKVKVTVI